MSDQITPEEIAQHYAAMGDSVAVINGFVAEPAAYLDTEDALRRNVVHLKAMRARDFWTDEDMTAVDAAITAGTARIAEVEADGVERPPTFAQVNAERERRLIAGASFTVAGVTDPIPLQGRPFDQTVYLALLTRASGYKAAGVTTPVLKIRDAVDAIHLLTPDQMISLISQAMTWFEGVMATSWAMKDGTGDFTDGIPSDFTDDTHWP